MSLYKLGISDKTTAAAQNSDPEVQQMLENAQQNNQIQKPLNDGILDAIKELFGFGSAQSAEMPQVPNLTYRNIDLPFNLNTGVTNTTQAAPFLKSMADIEASGNVNTDLVNQLIMENQMKASQNFIGSPFLNVPRGTETISQNTGVPGVVEPDGSFRVIPGYIDRNTNIYRGDAAVSKPNTSNLNLNSLPANMGVANEPDEEQVEYLTEQEPSGIAKLFEFLNPFKGLAALSDKLKQSSMYRPSTTGVFGYTPAQLNQMNALGGYYSAPERERRRRANRISNMLNRAAEGKNYSKKNLSNLMNQFGMGDVDTGSMIQSIKESSNMGYGKGDVGLGSGGGRDYSSSPGAMAGDMEYDEE
jgi:hypothetical protein